MIDEIEDNSGSFKPQSNSDGPFKDQNDPTLTQKPMSMEYEDNTYNQGSTYIPPNYNPTGTFNNNNIRQQNPVMGSNYYPNNPYMGGGMYPNPMMGGGMYPNPMMGGGMYGQPMDPISIQRMQMLGRNLTNDTLIQKYWRPAMAVIYMLLILLDYGIRPLVNQYYAKEFDLAGTVIIISDLSPSTQIQALTIASRNEIWPPILNEMIHIAFGAILTAAATTRGLEKMRRVTMMGRGRSMNNNYRGGYNGGGGDILI